MRERFAGRHADHVGADRTAEQLREAINRAARLGHVRDERVEPVAMLLFQRVEPRVEAVERVAVAGQDEQVGGAGLLDLLSATARPPVRGPGGGPWAPARRERPASSCRPTARPGSADQRRPP